MSHHAESRGHVATKLCLRYTRVERYRLMMIFKEGEKENRRYSNRDVRKGSFIRPEGNIGQGTIRLAKPYQIVPL